MQRLIVYFGLILLGLASTVFGQSTAKFSIPQGKMLLVVGQDLSAIGGFDAPNNNGYVDNFNILPGGVTFYTNLPSLMGLEDNINYGAGDVCAPCVVDNPTLKNSAISIGLYMVDALESIGRGTYDEEIKELGRFIKKTNRPVFLRIGYEFDGNWNHYEPKAYQVAFRRIVDIFRTMNVDNCATVWHSGTSPVDDKIEGFHENIGDWWPGDDYVDYCGYSWFVAAEEQVKLTDELVNFARAHKKPVMVCESSPQGYDVVRLTRRNFGMVYDGPAGENLQVKTSEQIWSEWFVPFFDYIQKNQDVVKVVAYIDCNWDVQPMWGPPYKDGYWGDCRVEANKYIKAKWLETITQPQFLNGSPELFTVMGYVKH